MNILFATSEAYPFIKTGGLGDVSYALPKALKKIGVDVRVILPKYNSIPEEYVNNMRKIAEFTIKVGWRNKYCGLLELEKDGLKFYFIDNEYYFKRDSAYAQMDDGERFSFFSKAIIESINYMNDFTPDILHCNDWHTAISIPILRDQYFNNTKLNHIKTVYTIHNLKYQGVFSKEMLGELLNFGNEYFSEEKFKYYDAISFMKAGIVYADAVTTVSPTYAQEIKTEYYGEGLHGLLQSRSNDLYGILNGIDTDINNPSTDMHLFEKYDANNLQGKSKNKRELQKMLNLPENNNIPMIGIVSRLEEQKGFDLLKEVIEELLQENIQLVVLGTGDQKYEDLFKFFAWKYPDKLSANIYFDNSLGQKIYAASDMFLMPSRFEPCGIGQLIALKYGSVPIVRETGGLNDTVSSYNEFTREGNGFSFTRFDARDMLYTIRRAIGFYYDKDLWRELIQRGMRGDYSWGKSANEYIDIYNNVINKW
ncbi:glycogen synthase GlgA [Clostridium botulinum C]|uniref:Glycogen synthase n=3 Tax=Clostridium botulinum TaxID=1491 RepID=A0A9Q4TG30_CLOBO|nr:MULTISPECIES: glycogen synthase GlgA [Clostridium]EES91482.1 glycogen synthase [Clostridium botulinum D str. 1873]MBO3441501.1 glycogen synthase GlgA [Clostridium haemolyticum]MCD3194727.1 glycogen synthase GlgA [Clostridium botulinum C]MCD3200120.1 glycogen synthase GlgA [Clostridium botulinum C]MCD3205595.1 glycogen synthase GlgA [Clostridium botulinum C]